MRENLIRITLRLEAEGENAALTAVRRQNLVVGEASSRREKLQQGEGEQGGAAQIFIEHTLESTKVIF